MIKSIKEWRWVYDVHMSKFVPVGAEVTLFVLKLNDGASGEGAASKSHIYLWPYF
jgi:hypothetical protein